MHHADTMEADVSDLIADLNDAQREAVCARLGRSLVLAGAGSGKTRVLTRRAAWLVRVEGASPFGIMAVTFTNKAAAEMRHRIGDLLGIRTAGMWVGTFHGLSHRLLRMHAADAGLPETFQILDSDDQLRLIKRVMRGMELDEKRYPPRQVRGVLNGWKEEGLRPADIETDTSEPFRFAVWQVYQTYEEACRRAGLVDFAELLLRSFELLRDRPELLAHYRARFRHLLVDEFQDTNQLQYRWLQQLAGDDSDVFVVGDDDQSIYGWRGARVENIRRYTREFGEVAVTRLEQNYRSTETILSAANALISHNGGRMGKNLWTEGNRGDPIQLYAAFNETDEARYVVDRIATLLDEGYARNDFAILYRSNAQSRAFEESLLARGLPYRVYGGQRFFDRAEIRDALAYLRLLMNRHDDAAFERVINTPRRGIGNRTLDQIRQGSREAGVSLWEAACRIVRAGAISARAGNAVQGFLQLLDRLEEETATLALHEQMDRVIIGSGLRKEAEADSSDRGEARRENLDELVTAARNFEQQYEKDEGLTPLTAFLTHAALEAGEAQGEEGEACIQLMTLHSAKGLEFPVVFLVGLEEGLFPHRMSTEEPGRMEEERRLAYVGITRARERLYLAYAEKRRLHGMDNYGMPSRFIQEIPADYIEEVRARMKVTRPGATAAAMQSEPVDGITLGSRVRHERFGEGVVLRLEGQGPSARIQVQFARAGAKWLVAAYANLTLVG
ncbi:ATP-dependent DNA helicase UvrD [Alkalispirillum mobile]|uniref:DNA 3'-5' helicase n=1 Tax=Alkalispirillum mobile TaxID=85925 RepID=A0A498C210_9GAMM|nr:DNA helicase II [Alkalispirillum mobile]RLK46491.1 ATP-dependent DNA helicase UvrD [Alkalispirillum mobile]